MKTILLLSAALFFSGITLAQTDGKPDFPYATYEYVQMATDNPAMNPWGLLGIRIQKPPLNDGPIGPTAKKLEGMMAPDNVLPSVAAPHRKKMLPY